MKPSSNHMSVLFFYGISIVAMMLYTYGFFPLEDLFKPDTASSKKKYEEREEKQRHVQKLVFFVIDALRYDFVASENQNYMPFVKSSIQENKSCLLTTKAHSPTVTMPRIKAITSGIVPSFFDVVLNLKSSSFEHDNFVTQAFNNGYQLVFYGDDTWLKLFPNHFIRHEGVTSFFASDYTEVDNNVTRNVYEELRRDDWDVMILHYLGLDHIGHMEGPKSLLVPPKLKEMDLIIEKIANYLQEKKDVKTMLIVTGDHGMKDSGSHGGVTFPEVTIPLVSIGQPCYQLPGWPENNIVPQIDIAPTISTLLGLPIPTNNVGKLIPQLLNGMTQEKILEELLTNLKKLSNNQTSIPTDKYSLTELANQYFIKLNELSEAASKSKTEFKLSFLYVSVFAFLTSSSFFLFKIVRRLKPKKFSHWILILGSVVHTISYASTSFIEEEHQTWYFFWITFCVVVATESEGKLKDASKWIAICFSHRILRKLNQTGDKWASLPDIQSYLNSPENRILLFIVFLLGIIGLFYCCYNENCIQGQTLIYGITLLIIIFYRLAVNNIHMELIPYPTSRGYTAVKLFWAFASLFALQTIRNETPIYLIWSLIAGLLFRPHNLILIPIQVYTSKTIHQYFHKPQYVVWNNIAHVWLGYVFYFYQGNGNSISNIDVASGFIGSEEYQPIYAFFMTQAHTSSAIILSFLLSPKWDLVYAALRIIPHTFFCTLLIFQLHHLFIWSVFSPKLLYETNLTIVTFTCLLLYAFFK